MRILKLKIDSMRLQSPRRWVSFSFSNSYVSFLVASPRFLPFRPPALSLSFAILSFDLPSNFLISLVLFVLRFPPLFCALLSTSTSSTHSFSPTVCSFSQSCFRNLHQARRTTPLESSRIVGRTSHTWLESKPNHPRSLKIFGSLNPVPFMRTVQLLWESGERSVHWEVDEVSGEYAPPSHASLVVNESTDS